MSGRTSLVADDGECESFHRSAQAPPATPGTSRQLMTPQVTA